MQSSGKASSSGEASQTRSYRGRVVSGRGIGKRVLGELKPQLRQEIGVTIVDGSLNVVLNRPVRLRDSTALVMGGGKRRFWPASVAGTRVWVYRWPGATEHLIELVAEHHLRSTMHLEDGDTIRVTFRSKDIEPTSPLRLLAWAIMWMGRGRWYYTKDEYVRRVGVVMSRTVAIRDGLRRVVRRVIRGGRGLAGALLRMPATPHPDISELGGIPGDGTDEPADS